jgi:hypothetical protein
MMKKFSIRLIIFLAGGIAAVFALSTIANRFDPLSNVRIDVLISKADSIQALALGNSHSCAIDFNELGFNGYRVADGGNDMFEVEYQVKVLFPYLPDLEIVFINISYFSFFIDNAAITEHIAFFSKSQYDDFIKNYPYTKDLIKPLDFGTYLVYDLEKIDSQKKNKLGEALKVLNDHTSDRSLIRLGYYQTLPEWKWVDNDFLNFAKSRFTPVIRKDHWWGVISSSLNLEESTRGEDLDEYGQPDDARSNSFMEFDKLEKHAEEIAVPWYTYLQEWSLQNNPGILYKSYNSLRNTISILKSRNIRIVFYTSPVFKKFTDLFDKQKIRTTEEYMEKLKKEFDIEY